ncbi:hypothetical protein [Spirosoma sordidisoli]|uniref:Uncharacterized protein n=1 Tax=Spirosoma sordidisoli TaxID=2502893 RepID=A0A4Q2USF4_9BACT|nr:hypothetical protein [Spirosoma sordidisoli]RYC70685.1 hypothetical protein EQG79_00605 [Spirosoma sordidisoli]
MSKLKIRSFCHDGWLYSDITSDQVHRIENVPLPDNAKSVELYVVLDSREDANLVTGALGKIAACFAADSAKEKNADAGVIFTPIEPSSTIESPFIEKNEKGYGTIVLSAEQAKTIALRARVAKEKDDQEFAEVFAGIQQAAKQGCLIKKFDSRHGFSTELLARLRKERYKVSEFQPNYNPGQTGSIIVSWEI